MGELGEVKRSHETWREFRARLNDNELGGGMSFDERIQQAVRWSGLMLARCTSLSFVGSDLRTAATRES